MMEIGTRRHFVVFVGVVAMTLLRANVVAAQNSEDWWGSWAFELPDGNPAWLRIACDGNGLEGELLWSVGSAQPLTALTLDGGTLQFRRKLQWRPFGDSAVKLIREPMIATLNESGMHIPSEIIHGTFADYAVVPRRNVVPLPQGLSPLHASVLGTAWLTAYRALFTKSGLRAGETVLIQGATGGMATALIQLGRAAGFEVWATSRSEAGQELARSLGAHRTFPSNTPLPRKVRTIIDSLGADSWAHSLSSLARGGTLVIVGGTTGFEVPLNVLPMIADQLTIVGSIMGTLEDMENLVRLIASDGIEPEIGEVSPMERAAEGFQAMWDGHTHGKTVFTRHESKSGSRGTRSTEQ